MKRLNHRLYGIMKDTEEMYKLGICRFSTYLYIRGLYNDSIRPKPLNRP